jgi:hypothetical protein
MAHDAALIIEVPAGSALERSLRRDPPGGPAHGEVVLVGLEAGEHGRLAAPHAGQVVLSVPSPETLPREPEEVRRVIDGVPAGIEPLIILVEEAESFREEELSPILEASKHARRSVILRVMHTPDD